MRSFALTSIVALLLSSVSATWPSEDFNNQHHQPHGHHQEGGDLVLAGYTCGSNFYSESRVEKTLKVACKEVKKSRFFKRRFPKVYEPANSEAKFDGVRGTQMMYPILRKRSYSRLHKARRDRIILTSECEFLGLAKHKKSLGAILTGGLAGKSSYQKCTKVYKKSD